MGGKKKGKRDLYHATKANNRIICIQCPETFQLWSTLVILPLYSSEKKKKGKNREGGGVNIMLVVESWVGLSLPARWLSAPGGTAVLPRSPAPRAAGTERPWARPPPANATWPPSAAYRNPVDEVLAKNQNARKG